MVELGIGVLNWERQERVSDRYGFVYLADTPESSVPIDFDRSHGGQHGLLIAIVKEIRQSTHVGDYFHMVFPETPKVGQKITLGKGTLLFKNGHVGIKPDDKRNTLWLDIKALYRVHEQTVTLCFEPG